MFPLNAIPVSGNTKFQVFYANGSTDANPNWQAWQKPAGCSMVYIWAMSGGGGGGRPANGATTVGGGGGGSAGITRALIPAILLPDTLYIQVGIGGLGATTANSAGGNGGTTWVQVQPDTTTANRVAASNFGSGGQASSTGGTAGAAGTNTNQTYASLGLWYTIAGQAGNNGASAANGTGNGITSLASGIITTAGAGGGNGTGGGGTVNSAGAFFAGVAGGTGNGGNGNTGFQKGLPILQGLKTTPLLFSGGSGGGGGTTNQAGRGGDASYGGGGGGGGGCSGAGTSGNGGNGGDGFVIIGTF